MPYALSILKVKDYAKWKSGFDREDGVALRKAFARCYTPLQKYAGFL